MASVREIDIRSRNRLTADGVDVPEGIAFMALATFTNGSDHLFAFDSELALAGFLRSKHPTPFDSLLRITIRPGRGEDAAELISRLESLIDDLPALH